MQSILVTQQDIASLMAGYEYLERKMTHLSLSHEALEPVVKEEVERNRLQEEFDVVSRENNETLKMKT